MQIIPLPNGDYALVPDDELCHFGVKGMKWGRRKARPVTTGTQGSGQTSPADEAARKEARKQKAIKAAKVGAVVAGTVLAAYGTYKLAKYTQNKRNQAALNKAQDYVNKNIFKQVGDTKFRDGTRIMDFENAVGNKITTQGARKNVGKAVGELNAKTIATGRQMYRDATNTRLDRGLAKVVNTGDAIGNAAKRAASSARQGVTNAASSARQGVTKAATTAKNRVLDVVNPIYEYTPSTTTRSWTTDHGGQMTQTVTRYVKGKRKRR